MDKTLVWVIVIGVIVGFVLLRILVSKGINTAAKAVNKHVLFKSEYEEQQKFISTALTFVTTASKDKIMEALTDYVAPVQTIPVVGYAVYQLSSSADTVVYAFGNKLYPKWFIVSVSLTNRGEMTQGTFNFLKWHERDGMLPSMEHMEKLRNNIIAAFTAADSSVRITEGTVHVDFDEPVVTESTTSPEKDNANIGFAEPMAANSNLSAPKWRCSCGSYNRKDDVFCVYCGNGKPTE